MIRIKPKKSGPAPIDPEKLKRYVARIEAVEEEEAAQKDAKKDIYTEVKAAGMRPKMVRKIVKERKAKAVDAAEEAELETYRAALAMPGATYRSVAEKIGIPKSTLHRLVPRAKNGTEPKHDPDTGEITETAGPHTTPPGDGSERAEPKAASGAAVANESNAAPEDRIADAPSSLLGGPSASHLSAPQPAPEDGVGAGTNSDGLDIPTFLRRAQEVRA